MSNTRIERDSMGELYVHPILVTALNPIIGYQKAAEIATLAYKQGRPIIDVALEHTDLQRSQLEALLDPEKLTAGGI
jgi:fumarate hydratase class II